MNYARAVKEPYTEGEIINLIQEQAELELQRFLSNDEIILLSHKLSPEQLWQKMKKVCYGFYRINA